MATDIIARGMAKKAEKTPVRIFTYKGSVSTFADLPATANDGDIYTVLTETTGHLPGQYIYSTNQTAWIYKPEGPVTSVNGQKGNVVLKAEDITTEDESNVEDELAAKVGIQQNVEDAGKVLGIDDNGRVIPKAIAGGGQFFSSNGPAKIADYANVIKFNVVEELKAKEYYESLKIPALFNAENIERKGFGVGGCDSAYIQGLGAIRWFDWNYNETASQVVFIDQPGKYKILGNANASALTQAKVDSKEYDDAYTILPTNLVDGINEHGLYASILVAPTDLSITRGTTPETETREEISFLMLVYWILSNCSSVDNALYKLQNYISMYNILPLAQMGYEAHYHLCDTSRSAILEFVNGELVVVEDKETDIITNFLKTGVQYNDDRKVYTPATQDATHNAMITNLITAHGAGLERYNLLRGLMANIKSMSMQDILNLVQSLFYTNAYSERVSPTWLTEFVGIYKGVDYTVATEPQTYLADGGIVQAARQEFSRRQRDGKTWQTVHACMYDFESLTMLVGFQEDINHIFEYKLETGEPDLTSCLSIREYQYLDDNKFNVVHQNLRDGMYIENRRELNPVYSLYDQNIQFDATNNQYVIPNVNLKTLEQKSYDITLGLNNAYFHLEGGCKGNNTIDIGGDISYCIIENIVNDEANNQLIINVSNPVEQMPNLTSIDISTIEESRILHPVSDDFLPDYIRSIEEDSDNNCYVITRKDNTQLILPKLPALPTNDGNYALACSVSGGTITYYWTQLKE